MTARLPIGHPPARCKNAHAPEAMHQIVDSNGRVMSVCSECRRKARHSQPVRPSRARTLIDRLLDRRTILDSGCWVTDLHHNGHGYRVIAPWRGKKVYVHRLAYEHFVGPIPNGLQLDHLCRNRGCFNPDHLEPVTPAENTRRAQKPTCKRGHSLSGDNARTYGNRRQCRTCDRERAREKYQQHPTEMAAAARRRRVANKMERKGLR